MKKVFILIITLFQFTSALSQSKTAHLIFKNDHNWKQEVIEFPIDWAPKVQLQGFEEILFTPEWSNAGSQEFWSLLIGWKVDANPELTLEEIRDNFFGYFDGLMKPNHWATEFPEPKVHFTKKDSQHFEGHMTFFDGFYTGKVITVNIQGSQQFRYDDKKSIITFCISPQEKNHPIWNQLKKIPLKKEKVNNLIDLDENWGKEAFPFPINFAPDIPYRGLAEVRFPPKGWRDPKHPNFWSYTYVWDVELTREVTSDELSENLVTYFNGLNESKDDMTKTKAVLIKIGKDNLTTHFTGTVEIYDRFATHKRITLNVLIESNYCPQRQKTQIFFKFSPKDLTHATWKMLKSIKLTPTTCE